MSYYHKFDNGQRLNLEEIQGYKSEDLYGKYFINFLLKGRVALYSVYFETQTDRDKELSWLDDWFALGEFLEENYY